MNYIKSDSTGIDAVIAKLQKKLYDKLAPDWGNIDGYGRIYRNAKDGKVYPEYYDSDGNYHDVLMDDSKNAIFFFDVHPDIKSVTHNFEVATVDIIVFVNLDEIKGLQQRQDQEIRKDFSKILRYKPYNYEVKKIDLTIDRVYSQFKGIPELLKNKDMSYYHHFKVSGSLSYSTNNC